MHKTKISIPNQIDEVTVLQMQAAAALVFRLQIVLGKAPEPVAPYKYNLQAYDFAKFEPKEIEDKETEAAAILAYLQTDFAIEQIAVYIQKPIELVRKWVLYEYFTDSIVKNISELFEAFSYHNETFATTTPQKGIYYQNEMIGGTDTMVWLAFKDDITEYPTKQVVEAALQPIEWGNDIKCYFALFLAYFLRRATMNADGSFEYLDEDLTLKNNEYVINYDMIIRYKEYIESLPLKTVSPLFFCIVNMPTMRLRIEKWLFQFLQAAKQIAVH